MKEKIIALSFVIPYILIASSRLTRRIHLSLFLVLPLFFFILPRLSSAEQIQDYSILAVNSVQFEKEAKVLSGHVGVNDRATGPVLDKKNNVEFSADKEVLFEAEVNLTAPRVLLEKETRVKGGVFYRDALLVKEGVVIEGPRVIKDNPAQWPLFSIPGTMTCSPNVNNNAVVNKEETGRLLPGAYGDINVGKGASLVLEGGQYHSQFKELVDKQVQKLLKIGELEEVDEMLKTQA